MRYNAARDQGRLSSFPFFVSRFDISTWDVDCETEGFMEAKQAIAFADTKRRIRNLNDVLRTTFDPHGEHDSRAFDLAGQRFFFKIGDYDSTLKLGSNDPSDPRITTQVLTVTLAEEC
jgi:hypothetical protein